ncbi:MAG: hypothetical protein H8F28_14445 [Fibrella sp.]|nr:hypothetical protein [Armatimonadota bacterium]
MIVPGSKPKQSEAETTELLEGAGIDLAVVKVAVVAVRGYYLDTMGKGGVNDRGIYDDAVFVVSANAYAAFNANTDPSVYRPRTASKQGVASLMPGVHWYRKGNHGISRPGGGYPAFRPANAQEKLPVSRDGESGTTWGIAINIHRGSLRSTSSEGCQTIYPPQWDSFYNLLSGEMKRAGVTKFPYLLVKAQ